MATNWGILATGRIAHKLAAAIVRSETGNLVAVGSRSVESAQAFADHYDEVTPHATYESLLDDSNVDAIYVATPHPQHAEWTIKALRAGKAVLCEKPMGVNHAEVMAMVHAAETNHSFLMEAFMYRLHPQAQKIVELVRAGAIGELRHIHATFGFHAPFNPDSRLFSNALAGGGIMDVGCYPVSLSRLVAGTEPRQVSAHGILAETGADLYTAALLHFPNGVSAQVATGVGQQLDNTAAIYGSQGNIRIAGPWVSPQNWSIELNRQGKQETIKGTALDVYEYEVNEVDRCRNEGLLQSDAMDWDDSLGNVRTLDMWRNAMNMEYEFEKPANLLVPVHGSPLSATRQSMNYGNVDGIDLPLSRVVMGCDNQASMTHSSVMFDQFFEAGGNVFDTAYIYGGGRPESYLGQWIKNRNVRDELALIGKGAHTPLNFPENISPQLNTSLERLQTDHIDLYFLHRDNLDVPVGEWVDALNDQQNEGKLTIFGGSNWSLERIQEANEYATKTGKSGFSIVSNQFSLARMLSPVWAGCISANDSEFIEYLTTNQIPLFPWSSQARGFFTARPDQIRDQESSTGNRFGLQPSDDEMVRCWFSDQNFERRTRAHALAEKHEVDPINIALAFVLNQDFPTFPLIGPRIMSETSSCLKSLQVSFDSNEVAWLDLKTDRVD